MSEKQDAKQATGEISGEFITKKELAKRLRVSTRKIELDTDLPAIRFGRTVRYDWQDVHSYLKGKEAKSA